MRAAREATRLDTEVGVAALQDMTFAERFPTTLQLEALTALCEVAPDAGLETARRLVDNSKTWDELRFGAAEQIWLLDRESGRAVIRRIALTSAAGSGDRIRFGRRIGGRDKELGIEILRHVAFDTMESPGVRLQAAAGVEELDVAEGVQLRARLTTESPIKGYLKQTEGRDA